jgi:hypothetical protein
MAEKILSHFSNLENWDLFVISYLEFGYRSIANLAAI